MAMFSLIQPSDVSNNPELMMSTFRLRKKVFADTLKWDVPVTGDREFDDYDSAGASYLVWTTDDRRDAYAVVRIMPTDGPTLLNDVFWATHRRNPALAAADVWEATRMCLDDERIARDFPGMGGARAVGLLLIALCEAALACGIRRMASNFEPAMARVYRRAGVDMTMHGSADGYGRRPVCCASFEISARVLGEMRARVGISLPLFRPRAGFVPPLAPVPATAGAVGG